MNETRSLLRLLRKPWSRLAVQVTVVIVAVAVAISASALFMLHEQRTSALASATTDSLRIAQSLARTEQRFIGDALQVLDFFAQSPTVRNGSACESFVHDLVRENHGYANAGAAWANGEVFCSAVPSAIGVNLSGLAFFDKAVGGVPAAAFPRVARFSPQAAAAVAVPFRDVDGVVRGVVFVAQRLDWIRGALSSTYLPTGSAIGLLDRGGSGFVRVTADTLRVTRVLTRVIDGKAILANGEGIVQLPVDGSPDHFFAFHAVSDGVGGTIGYAYVDIPVGALGELNKHIAALAILFFAVAASVAFFGGLAIAWALIVGRLRKLSDAVTRRAAGDESAALPTMANGEIGRLASAFATLARSASVTRGELEKHIAAIEAEVNAMLEQAAVRNRDLEDTRSAMINLMEDLDVDHKEIAKEKIRAEALLAGIGDGILAMNGDATIVFANTHCERLLGFPPGWLVGKSFFDTVQMTDDRGIRIPLQQRPVMRAMKTLARIEFPQWRSVNFVRADGSLLPISGVGMPLIENTKVIGSLILFRDVSHEREIDRAKSEFISVASHQLRTPPTAIRWYSEMLLEGDEGKLTPGQKRTVVQIHDSSVRMIELIGALLNISRMELGMYSVRPKSVNPANIVKALLEEAAWDIRQKHLTVEMSVATGVHHIAADPDILRIVLENLLSNAVKYSNRGGRIVIAIQMEAKEMRIDVRDNGIGIPKEQQPMVFTKFFRASNISLIPGTGLGLYVVKSMCRYAGCQLRFVSEPGRGTMFSLFIPEDGMHAKEGEHLLFDLLGGLPNLGMASKEKSKKVDIRPKIA